MKRFLMFALVMVIPAAAQWRHFGYEPTQPTGYVGVGFAAPVNPVARGLDAGWNLAGGVGVSGEYAGVMVDALFAHFGINPNTLAQKGALSGSQSYWAITVDPVFHVNHRGPVDFYVTGGGGLYSRVNRYGLSLAGAFSGENLVVSDTIFKPGVDGGCGFSFDTGRGSRMKVFLEARFHHMFTSGSGASFVPITLGVRF